MTTGGTYYSWRNDRYSLRGIEYARAAGKTDNEVRLVPTVVNGRTEMLPSDPLETSKILKERRAKSPAAKARAKMVADLKRRCIG
ncbi:hypothetical protein [Rhizobium rhizogenes]|uniref:hypothetical protein n=1 Tax=Rhizobium rhizogenes TaxID=359 RepID=UPI0005A1FD93|nr:hypothetical protein [Rhizobium rhizogenes]NTG06475.1 hypothetical protein [Rhizobium rhizogenes]